MVGSQCKRRQNTEIKTVEKTTRNSSTKLPKKSWQFEDNKERGSVASYDHLRPVGTWH